MSAVLLRKAEKLLSVDLVFVRYVEEQPIQQLLYERLFFLRRHVRPAVVIQIHLRHVVVDRVIDALRAVDLLPGLMAYAGKEGYDEYCEDLAEKARRYLAGRRCGQSPHKNKQRDRRSSSDLGRSADRR